MKEYGSIPKFLDDMTLKGEQVVAFNKLHNTFLEDKWK